MCIVSYCGDYFRDTAPQKPWWPAVEPLVSPPITTFTFPQPEITREEFDALKRDIEELKLLLKAAKRYDEATGQPDCEMESKVVLIKKLADLVGVDLSEVFK